MFPRDWFLPEPGQTGQAKWRFSSNHMRRYTIRLCRLPAFRTAEKINN